MFIYFLNWDNLVLIVEKADSALRKGEFFGKYPGVSLDVPDLHKAYNLLVAKGIQFSFSPQNEFWDAYREDFKDLDDKVWTQAGTWNGE